MTKQFFFDYQSLRVFIGYDERQPLAFNVLQYSIVKRCSKPVSITPLVLSTLPMTRRGLTPFTFSRFLVPWLCGFQGWALFLDADILVLDDIAELFNHADDKFAALVVKNEKRFEWASVILFNCAKGVHQNLQPEMVNDPETDGLLRLTWIPDEQIGALPSEWNHLVGYDKQRTDAKLVHFTQGMPYYEECKGSEYASRWADEAKEAFSAVSWAEVMGRSVHAAPHKDGTRLVAKLHPEARAVNA